MAEFKVKRMMISNPKGQFTGAKGGLALEETDFNNSRIEASIRGAASINTRDDQRQGHLKSAYFFDAEKFSMLSFESTRVTRVADGKLGVAGALTIR